MPFIANPGPKGSQPPVAATGGPGGDLQAQQQQAIQAAMGAYQQVFGALFAGTATGAALKPVPAAVSDIQNRDPAFDQTNFLARAEYAYHLVQQAIAQQKPEMSRQVMADALWLQSRDAIQAARQGGAAVHPIPDATGSITAAHTDSSYDTIVVRFTPTAGGTAQDWSFQRSATAVTKPEASSTPDRCPNCGAPLQLDETGVCSYCKAAVSSGQYDWVLVRTEPVANPTAAWNMVVGSGSGFSMTNYATLAQEAEVVAGAGRSMVRVFVSVGIVLLILLAAGGYELYDNVIKRGSITSGIPQTGSGTRYAGSLQLSGALTSSGLSLSGTSSTRPNCQALAAVDKGATSTYTLTGPTGSSKIELDLDHPTGPGTYNKSNTSMTIIETPSTGSGGNQIWKPGSDSTLSFRQDNDDGYALTFSNLQAQNPAGPHASPLSGSYTETCTNR